MTTTKICEYCKTEFSTNDRRKKFCKKSCGSKAWATNNPDKVRLKSKNWGRANSDKVKAKNKLWQEANRQISKQVSKAWRKKNPDKVKAAKKKFRKDHPDKVNLANRRRKCRKLGISHEPYLNSDIFVRDKWRCHICNANTKGSKHPHPNSPSIDHVIPTSKGGADAPHNVACACLGCNLKKNDRTITLF